MSNYWFHCAPISEIPSNISTMPACHMTKIYFLFFLIEQWVLIFFIWNKASIIHYSAKKIFSSQYNHLMLFMPFHVSPSIFSGIIYFSRCLWRIYVDLYNLRPGQRNNGENIPLYSPIVCNHILFRGGVLAWG